MPSTTKPTAGYIGIDNGTQGLSVLLTDENLQVLARGEATYQFVTPLPSGHYEQRAQDWDVALSAAMQQALQAVNNLPNFSEKNWKPLAIGISGQMHGEVLVGDTPDQQPIAPVRLWCDARNEETAQELTQRWNCKIPKRVTAARFLWTARHRPQHALQTRHITTPGGWCAFRLTGEWKLGIGEASGMFPIQTNGQYDTEKLKDYDQLLEEALRDSTTGDSDDPIERMPHKMVDLLPRVQRAGEDAGSLTAEGAALLGLDSDSVGIPVAPAEGDQIAALAGSLIAQAGTISCSFGTSVCANAIGDHDRAFQGVSPAVDQYCAADAAPLNMVWLRNGTTFLNAMVQQSGGDFETVMPQLIAAPTDCGGLLALPFMDDEPGLNVQQGGSSACIVGWTSENACPGNVAKAALLSTMLNLKLGVQVLDRQGYPRTELILTGGLSKTPDCAQILADVFDTPVTLLEASADEGCSWGAAVLAKYRHLCQQGYAGDWKAFLASIQQDHEVLRFPPNRERVAFYEKMFARHQKLIKLQAQLADTLQD